MPAPKKIFVKSAFFFIIGVVLATLFFWTLLEGIKLQLSNDKTSMVYYFLAFVSGIAAVYNYLQSRTLFHYAKLG